jgi:hypothetical protein
VTYFILKDNKTFITITSNALHKKEATNNDRCVSELKVYVYWGHPGVRCVMELWVSLSQVCHGVISVIDPELSLSIASTAGHQE